MWKPSIAMVEADPAMGVLMDELLTGEGYAVRLWPTSGDAFDFIQREPTDLVILDLSLNQRGDGIAILEQLCRDVATCEIPVIVLADDSHALSMLRVLPSARRYEVLEKPFYLEQLVAIVDRVLMSSHLVPCGGDADDWAYDIVHN